MKIPNERLIVTWNEDGSFRGASISRVETTESGRRIPIDPEPLTEQEADDIIGDASSQAFTQLKAALDMVSEMERSAKEQKELTDETIQGLNSDIAELRAKVTLMAATIKSDTEARLAAEAFLEGKNACIDDQAKLINSLQETAKTNEERIINLVETNLMLSDKLEKQIKTNHKLSDRFATMEAHPDVIEAKRAKAKAEAEAAIRQANEAKRNAEEQLKVLEETTS